MCRSGRVRVRRAAAADGAARAALLRRALDAQRAPAFTAFCLHELTLQAAALCGAVLFIFCGWTAAQCAALVPVTALLVYVCVRGALHERAEAMVRQCRDEMLGVVAEYVGPVLAGGGGGGGGAPRHIKIVAEDTSTGTSTSDSDSDSDSGHMHTQVVGTASVLPHRYSDRAGWLCALAVRGGWGGRGVGGALAGGAARAALAGGAEGARGEGALGALHAAVSELQPAARSLLHRAGWECSGVFSVPVAGGAMSLQVARLTLRRDRTHSQ